MPAYFFPMICLLQKINDAYGSILTFNLTKTNSIFIFIVADSKVEPGDGNY